MNEFSIISYNLSLNMLASAVSSTLENVVPIIAISMFKSTMVRINVAKNNNVQSICSSGVFPKLKSSWLKSPIDSRYTYLRVFKYVSYGTSVYEVSIFSSWFLAKK